MIEWAAPTPIRRFADSPIPACSAGVCVWDESIPIVVVTTRDSNADVVTAVKHSANDLVVKPFRLGTLSEKITEVLQAVSQDDIDALING